MCVCMCVFISHRYHALPLRGLHQSSIYPDRGEEWQEKTVFVILFHLLSHWKCAEGKAGKESGGGAGEARGGRNTVLERLGRAKRAGTVATVEADRDKNYRFFNFKI